jgi:hypothetical protein
MPWLMSEVKKEMGNVIESRELLMGEYHDESGCSKRDASTITEI